MIVNTSFNTAGRATVDSPRHPFDGRDLRMQEKQHLPALDTSHRWRGRAEE